MSKRRKENQTAAGEAPMTTPPGRRGHAWTVVVVVGLIAVASYGAWKWQAAKQARTPPAIVQQPAGRMSVPPATTDEAKPLPMPVAARQTGVEFERLKGQWVRPDGGYVVEIKGVADDGKMDASYFNPKPIHVAKAEASREGTATKLYIEMRDVNYPGSNYNLIYDSARDLLRGVYYQAAMNASFEVYFVRSK